MPNSSQRHSTVVGKHYLRGRITIEIFSLVAPLALTTFEVLGRKKAF